VRGGGGRRPSTCCAAAHAATIGPVWAALLTGSEAARGRGTIGHDVRDATGRVPILWFQDIDEHPTPRQRFHVDVWAPGEVAQQRIAPAVAAGGVVVDDSHAPSYTVVADRPGRAARSRGRAARPPGRPNPCPRRRGRGSFGGG